MWLNVLPVRYYKLTFPPKKIILPERSLKKTLVKGGHEMGDGTLDDGTLESATKLETEGLLQRVADGYSIRLSLESSLSNPRIPGRERAKMLRVLARFMDQMEIYAEVLEDRGVPLPRHT